MKNVSIPKPPDVVTILWQRNPLDLTAPRTIVQSSIIGSSRPCTRLLADDKTYSAARDCLLRNGFKQLSSDRLGVFGVSLFVRQS